MAKPTDPFAYMRGFRRPSPRSDRGRSLIAEHLANRDAEQDKALRYVKKYLKDNDRVQVIAASGSGKTYIAYRLIVDAARQRPQFLSVVVAPWVELVDQTKKRFAEYFAQDGRRGGLYDLVVVCSDAEAKSPWGDFEHITIADLRDRLKAGEHRRTIVLTTNASVGKVGAVLQKHGPADLTIVDEAHHAAGSATRKTVREIHDLSSVKTVYMTATPRNVSQRVNERRSMDDEAMFGPVAYALTFGAAAQEKIIAESVLALLGVEDDAAARMFRNLANEGFRVKGADKDHFKYEVAAAIVTVRAMAEGRLQRVLTFHNTKLAAQDFSVLLRAVANAMRATHLGFGAIVEDTTNRRGLINDLTNLKHRGRDVNGYALSSCRVISEGFDLPSVDAVVVVDPRLSPIDVTQTINRGSRFDETKPGKKNVVIIPVLGENPHGTDEGDPRFNTVQRIMDLMRDVDAGVVGTLYGLAGLQRPQDIDAPIRSAPKIVTNLPVDVVKHVSLALIDPGITSWIGWFEELKALGQLVPQKRGGGLGAWISNQKQLYAHGNLASDRVELLGSLPFWSWKGNPARSEALWTEKFEAVRRLGSMPTQDTKLGRWVSSQKQLFKKGRLSDKRIGMLESLSFWDWSPHESLWQERYETLLRLGRMPLTIGVDGGMSDWGAFVSSQRRRRREGTLPSCYEELLDALPFWEWKTKSDQAAEHEALVLANHDATMSPREIGLRCGMTKETTRAILRKLGLPYAEDPRGSGPSITEEKAKRIIALRHEGLAWLEIEKRLGVRAPVARNVFKAKSWAHLHDGEPDFGRPRGEQHHNAVLTEEQARRVVDMLRNGSPYKEIAEAVGTRTHVIRQIARGSTWRHLLQEGEMLGNNNHRQHATLTEGDVRNAVEMRLDGMSYDAIAKTIGGVTGAAIRAICSGKSWTDVTGVRPGTRVTPKQPRLSETDIRKIVRLRKEGLTYAQIADSVEASVANVALICRGGSWTHITGGPVVPRPTKGTK